MESCKRWLFLAAGLAAAVVATSAIAQAVRSRTWEPVISVGWIPAVVVAVWPGAYRRCPSRRGGQIRRADLRR